MVKFRSENWYESYLAYRKQYPISLETLELGEFGVPSNMTAGYESPKHPVYAFLQRSGLAYGFPVHYPFQAPNQGRMSTRKTAKMLLVDTLTQLVFEHHGWDAAHMPEKIDEAGRLIQTYYRNMNRYAPQPDENAIENLLQQRIAFKRTWLDFRRSGINSHLFWDLYFFQEYLGVRNEQRMREEQLFENLFWRKKKMKISTMQLIVAAIHSDHRVSRGERVLQHQFKTSARYLTRGEKDRLQKQFREGLDLDYVNLPELPWLGRRYLLDLSLLALFADKEFNEQEQHFLDRLATKLQLDPEEINESKFLLGCFLMQHGRKLNFYNNRKNSVALISQAIGANAHKLTKASYLEYQETVELASIIGKLLKAQLGKTDPQKLPSEEEIAYALEQIKDLPRFLPFFSIMFMPVPGITELYILLACSIERLTGDNLKLLPSQFSKLVKKK